MEVGVKGSVGSDIGVAKASVEANTEKLRVSIPNGVRDWLTETIRFRNHRKVLLRIGLAHRRYTHFGVALHELWERKPA
jgi:hypothetical protein